MNAVAVTQHQIPQPQRPGRPRRRRAGHGQQGLRLYRPRFFQRHHRHRCARSEKSKPVNFLACPPNTRAHHLQTHGDLLLAVNGPSVWTMQVSQESYFTGTSGDALDRPAIHQRLARLRSVEAGSAARNRVPAARRAGAASHLVCRRALRLCFGPSAGILRPHAGHRRHGGADAAASRRQILAAGHVDRPAARTPTWPQGQALRAASCAWSPAISPTAPGATAALRWSMSRDPAKPKLVCHRNWDPPFGGGTHSPLPLPDRNLLIVADEANFADCSKGCATSGCLTFASRQIR